MALTKKTFGDLITYTRNSVGTYFDANGILRTAAVDQPRFQYDPATGLARGLSVWGQETNSLLWNRDLSNGVWTGSATIAKNAVGLDGVANSAWTVTDSSGAASQNRTQTVTVSNDGNTHSCKFFFRKNSGDEVNGIPAAGLIISGGTTVRQRVTIDTRDGSNASHAGSADGSYTVKDAGDWWEIEIFLANNSSGNTNLQYEIWPALTSTVGGATDLSATGTVVYDYGGVRLNSTFMGSPIKTAGSAVTRSADVATSTIGDEFNADEFSFVVDFIAPQDTSSRIPFTYMDTSSDFVNLVLNSGTLTLQIRSAGVNQTAKAIASGISGGDRVKAAVRVKESGVAASVGGAAVVTDSAILVPTLTQRKIGRTTNDTGHISSAIASVTEYPRALTDAELIAESTL